MAPSRYADKSIAADLFIVTSPFSPASFYEGCKLDVHDSFEQLVRRITTVIYMSDDEITRMAWSDNSHSYLPVDGSAVPNTYSSKNYSTTETDAVDTYTAIISMKGGL